VVDEVHLMAIYAQQNLYPGINPHLNSRLQQTGGGWQSFHHYHLTHLADELNRTMPEAYYAKPEESLQIAAYDSDFRTTRADILVREDTTPRETQAISPSPAASPTMSFSMTVYDREELLAIVIYNNDDTPVTRIEFLLPANKYPGSHYQDYLIKRQHTLSTGLRLVEMDFLHERRPILAEIPSYKDRDTDAYPYHITVSDPRPGLTRVKVEVYGFGVFDRIPLVQIPLDGTDTTPLDFGKMYNHTFAQRPFFRLVNYTQEPVNFEAYTEADQKRIREQMKAITAQYSEGA
jgi:hypothetical protein